MNTIFDPKKYTALQQREKRINRQSAQQLTQDPWREIRVKETEEIYFIPLLFTAGLLVGMATILLSK